jgi:hypothetical protein
MYIEQPQRHAGPLTYEISFARMITLSCQAPLKEGCMGFDQVAAHGRGLESDAAMLETCGPAFENAGGSPTLIVLLYEIKSCKKTKVASLRPCFRPQA